MGLLNGAQSTPFEVQVFLCQGDTIAVTLCFNLLAPEFGIKILAHPVCKMRIIQEPIKAAL
jgi:hypothetical protein